MLQVQIKKETLQFLEMLDELFQAANFRHSNINLQNILLISYNNSEISNDNLFYHRFRLKWDPHGKLKWRRLPKEIRVVTEKWQDLRDTIMREIENKYMKDITKINQIIINLINLCNDNSEDDKSVDIFRYCNITIKLITTPNKNEWMPKELEKFYTYIS